MTTNKPTLFDPESDSDATAETPPIKRVIGRPFQKGVSGNLSGRPKCAATFKDRCREFMETTGIDALFDLASKPGKDQRAALELLASHSYGRPTQPISGDSSLDPLEIIVTRRAAE